MNRVARFIVSSAWVLVGASDAGWALPAGVAAPACASVAPDPARQTPLAIVAARA